MVIVVFCLRIRFSAHRPVGTSRRSHIVTPEQHEGWFQFRHSSSTIFPKTNFSRVKGRVAHASSPPPGMRQPTPPSNKDFADGYDVGTIPLGIHVYK